MYHQTLVVFWILDLSQIYASNWLPYWKCQLLIATNVKPVCSICIFKSITLLVFKKLLATDTDIVREKQETISSSKIKYDRLQF